MQARLGESHRGRDVYSSTPSIPELWSASQHVLVLKVLGPGKHV